MKKLSDYKGEEALQLWSDLLDSFVDIMSDKEIADSLRARKPALLSAKLIVEKKPKEAIKILTRIDDTEIDGLNLLTRLASLVLEIVNDSTLQSFFGFAPAVRLEKTPTGSAMENTEEKESQDISSNM